MAADSERFSAQPLRRTASSPTVDRHIQQTLTLGAREMSTLADPGPERTAAATQANRVDPLELILNLRLTSGDDAAHRDWQRGEVVTDFLMRHREDGLAVLLDLLDTHATLATGSKVYTLPLQRLEQLRIFGSPAEHTKMVSLFETALAALHADPQPNLSHAKLERDLIAGLQEARGLAAQGR